MLAFFCFYDLLIVKRTLKISNAEQDAFAQSVQCGFEVHFLYPKIQNGG
jgi:hypothetical protein